MASERLQERRREAELVGSVGVEHQVASSQNAVELLLLDGLLKRRQVELASFGELTEQPGVSAEGPGTLLDVDRAAVGQDAQGRVGCLAADGIEDSGHGLSRGCVEELGEAVRLLGLPGGEGERQAHGGQAQQRGEGGDAAGRDVWGICGVPESTSGQEGDRSKAQQVVQVGASLGGGQEGYRHKDEYKSQ